MRLAVALLCLLPLAPNAEARTSIARLRTMVLPHEIEGVKAAFAAARQNDDTARLDFSEQRDLFTAFRVTDPRGRVRQGLARRQARLALRRHGARLDPL